MKFRWNIAPSQPLLAESLASALGITPLLGQCLLNRGLDDPDAIARFLDPRLKYLADPFLLPQMSDAVDRLYYSRANGEPVVIFGDYDVDGVTATALLTEVLRKLGWIIQYYLPHRMDEGYGLTQSAVENCLNKFPVKLLLAVDCGSSAAATIDWLKAAGVDVIVLDHHQVGSPAPNPLALVNPQLCGSFKELCSAGLAFKLAHAIVKEGRDLNIPEAFSLDLKLFLDFVALGTIADMVPLTGENRILVNRGLHQLVSTQRPGLVALKEIAQVSGSIGAYEIGFQLAPRLNAAGRMENALEAIHLLLATEAEEARALAQSLDARNRERQTVERGIAKEVIESIRARFDPLRDFVLVEGQEPWHLGVVGIVASRVLQEFYRPTIIFGGDGPHWRGSGRSVEGFDLAAALRECGDLLVRHGGHAMAAGVSLLPDKIESFRTRLNEIAQRCLKSEQLLPPLRLDGSVSLAILTFDQIRDLERLQHCGNGNPPVQFLAENLTQPRPLQRFGPDKRHVKLWVSDGQVTREAVWWNAGEFALPVGAFDLAFTPEMHEYNNLYTVRLKVLDWRTTG